MSQEQINVLLAALTITVPIVQFLLNKFFSHKKDNAEYGQDLLQIANDATEQLRKTRDDLTKTEDRYEEVIKSIRSEYQAVIKTMTIEADARHEGLKSRIAELERVTKMYTIKFDLITHPNVEIRNVEAKPRDDVSASQKLRAIKQDDINKLVNK
jgi:hypothetical protein